MSVSIRDIAERAGVATSTVSRVINPSQRYRISEETAQRVWDAVHELNYQVDHVARHIIRRRWHADKPRGGIYRLGVIHAGFSNELASSFYHDIIFGIQQEMLDRRLVLAGLYDVQQLQDEQLLFHATDPVEVDGLLLLAEWNDHLKKALKQRIKAVVMVGNEGESKIDSVTFDHHNAIRSMVHHLAGLGHKDIAYVGRDAGAGRITNSSRVRAQSYRTAMRELKLKVRKGYVIDTVDARRTQFGSQLAQFLSLKPRPTALVCASDRVCIEMLRRLVGAGIRVPEDVAMGGFEDLDMASFMIPRLTTVHAPREELGREAVRMLIDRLENPDSPPECRTLKTHLVIRESCGAPEEMREPVKLPPSARK